MRRLIWSCVVAVLGLSVSMNSVASRLVFSGHAVDQSFENKHVLLPRGDAENRGFMRYDVAYELWTLFGEPVFICHAKWQPVLDNTEVYLKQTDTSYVVSNADFAQTMRPYDVEILLPLSNNLYVVCDPGVLSKKAGENSFDSPGSRDWGKIFLTRDRAQGNRQHARNDSAHGALYWLDEEQARKTYQSLKNTMNKKQSGSFDFNRVEYRAGKDMSHAYLKYSGDILKSSYAMHKLNRHIQDKVAAQIKRQQPPVPAADDSTLDDVFAEHFQQLEVEEKQQQVKLYAGDAAGDYEQWRNRKRRAIDQRELPKGSQGGGVVVPSLRLIRETYD